MKEILNEDLEVDSPFSLLTYGMKIASQEPREAQTEMLEVQKKIQSRMQDFFTKKMKPLMQEVMREQLQLIMVEGVRYLKEIIYLIWIIFSMAQCSGIAVEHPVLERESKIRFQLNVMGLSQAAYWCANFLFDIACFAIQASLMVVLVYPLNLRAFQNQFDQFVKLMAFFGPAHISFSYLLSFIFTSPQAALKFISLIYMVSGFVVPLLLKMISVGLDRCKGDIYPTMQLITHMVPLHPMSTALLELIQSEHKAYFDFQDESSKLTIGWMVMDRAKNTQQGRLYEDFMSCDGYIRDVDSAV